MSTEETRLVWGRKSNLEVESSAQGDSLQYQEKDRVIRVLNVLVLRKVSTKKSLVSQRSKVSKET